MEPRRVRIAPLKPIAEDGEPRPIRRIPGDPLNHPISIEKELGIDEYSEEEQEVEVTVDPTSRGRIIATGEPLDCLCSNESIQMVCAGGARGVLRVFKVHEDNTLEHHVNFRRSTKRMNLLYSPLDVCWNPDDNNRLSTVSTNGSIVCWNLERIQIEFHTKVHKRSATTLKYHPQEANTLISGSKDATVIQYDMRKGEPVATFDSGTFEAIRDVQWSMHSGQENLFAAADDQGAARLWDRRRTDKPYLIIHAHHGYTSSVQFSPTARYMLATGGGRDKYIKVWDISRPTEEGSIYSIETVAPVCKAMWRPQGKGSTQLASCSVVNDTVVHFWDIRRPFMPYASFHDHRDSACALAFFQHDEGRFFSAGKDGLVVVHDFATHARYPINYANDISVDTAPDGLIGVAVNSLAPEKVPFVEKQAEKSIYSNPKPPKSPFVPIVPQSILVNSTAHATAAAAAAASAAPPTARSAASTASAAVAIPNAAGGTGGTPPSGSSSGRGTASSSLSSSPLNNLIPPKRVTIVDPKDEKEKEKQQSPSQQSRSPPSSIGSPFSMAAALAAAAVAGRGGAKSTYDPFRGPTQSLIRCGQPEHAEKHLTQRCFVELALEYRMGGASPQQLAGFNSDVAERHGLHDVARTWRLMTGLILRELRAKGYPEEWRMEAIERRKGRMEQLAIQMAEEGEYMSRTVFMERSAASAAGAAGAAGAAERQLQQGARLQIRPKDLVADFALDSFEPGFREDVLLKKKRRGKREGKEKPRSSSSRLVRSDEDENDTSGEEEGEREEDVEKRTSRLAKWRMRTRLRAKDKTNVERVPRTEAPSPVHDPMDDDARYGMFGEYHYGLQPTDVRRKTNEDLAWHGSRSSAHTWRVLPAEAFGVQDSVGVRVEEEEEEEWRGKKERWASGGEGRGGVRLRRATGSEESGEERRWSLSYSGLAARVRQMEEEQAAEEGETAARNVEDLLRRHADANDIQTCAAISIVFGQMIIDLIGEPLVFSWISAYESMLDRLRLMTAVTEVRKNCALPAIQNKSLAGTFLKLGCLSCHKLVTDGECEKCRRNVAATLCSVCHRELTGLGWSCDGCGHAAHSRHARDWFERFPSCPVTGCDCECAYWAPPEDSQPLLLRPKSLKTRPDRPAQQSMTVESIMLCDQLMAAELQEEYYRKRAWKMRTEIGTPSYLEKMMRERTDKIEKLKRHGVEIKDKEYDRWRELSSSSEEEIVRYEGGVRIEEKRRKKWKEENDRRRVLRKMQGRIHGSALCKLLEEVEDEEREEEEKREERERKGEGGKSRSVEGGEEIEWKRCRRGCECADCRLMGGWREELEEWKRRQKEWKRGPDGNEKRQRERFAHCLGRAMQREWGVRPKWKRFRKRYRPIIREGVNYESEEERNSDESNVTVFDRRMPADTPANFRRVRPGLGGGKEPRVPEEHRTHYERFTMESFAAMLEWQAVDWQRQLGVKRRLPRGFYRHPLFGMRREEMMELPTARLLQHLKDADGVMRAVGGGGEKRRTGGGGRRRRMRYSMRGWGRMEGEGRRGKRRRWRWRAAMVSGRKRDLKWNPGRMDYARRLMEEEEEDAGERKEHFTSAYSPRLVGWRRMGMARRMEVERMRRWGRRMVERNRPSTRVRYEKWARMEERVFWKGRERPSTGRIFDPEERKEREKREKEEEERERWMEGMLMEEEEEEGGLEEDLKALGISPAVTRPPRLGDAKPACVKIDVENEWKERGEDRKRFNTLDLFTEDEMVRISRMKLYLDDSALIARQNKAEDERTKRRNERFEKEREFEDAKRDYWKRYHQKKEDGEDVPPPVHIDPHEPKKEEKIRKRREANQMAKHERMLHKMVLARSVDHLVDLHMIDTRRK